MMKHSLTVAFFGLMALSAQADGIVPTVPSQVAFFGNAQLNVTSIGIGTLEFLVSAVQSPFTLTGVFSAIEPVLTWRNTGANVSLQQIGSGSDLACGSDCLFTLGSASFHINSISSVTGGGGIPGDYALSGLGTLVLPNFSVVDPFFLHVQGINFASTELANWNVQFVFGHATLLPAPLLGAGLPGLLVVLLTTFAARRLYRPTRSKS